MTLHTTTTGSGPNLVMLHGWGLHSGIWQEIAESFALEFRVTTIDMPGHGQSPMDLERFDLVSVAEAVRGAAPAEAFWLGWSLGGMVAQQLALDFPESVSRLALLSSSPRFVSAEDWPHAQPVSVMETFAADLELDYRATLNRFLALEARGSDRAREELRVLRERVFSAGEPNLDALRGGLEILRYADLRADVHRLQCPTLWLFGERDGLVPAAVAGDLAVLAEDAEVEIIQGAGHAAFISHPTLFTKAVSRFFYD